MRILMHYDTHWFFERQDGAGTWHTVADRNLLEHQAKLGHTGVESLNLQLQFVRTEMLAYNNWVGERSNSFDRWPHNASKNAARWMTNHLAIRAEIIEANSGFVDDDTPMNVPNCSFGVVGPCEGLAKPWAKPSGLERFLQRIEAARSQMDLLPLPLADTGWYNLNGKAILHQGQMTGHDVLRNQATARSLAKPTPTNTRLLFALKVSATGR